MTWKPESTETHEVVNLASTISSSIHNTHPGIRDKFKASSGKTYGNLEFPEAAPLVFPALDQLADQTGAEAEEKRNRFKRMGSFVDNYMDKRAQAKFVGLVPDCPFLRPIHTLFQLTVDVLC